MSSLRLASCVVLAGLCALSVEAKPRVRFGGVQVGAGYSRGYPFYYPSFYGPLFYDPFLFGFVHTGFYNGFGYGPNLGEVRLRTAPQDASVYLDGAYAGQATKLKTIWLEPGAYNFELRDGNRALFGKRIYVLTGKTLDIEKLR